MGTGIENLVSFKDHPPFGGLIYHEMSVCDKVGIYQNGDKYYVVAYSTVLQKLDEPHSYVVTSSRTITSDDITITWYADEYGIEAVESLRGNAMSARITITVDGVVVFNHLESFVENRKN